MRVIEKADIAPLEPLLCSIKAGSAVLGVSTRYIVDAIAIGKIKAVKDGRRTLLDVPSLKSYVKSLPAAKGTPLARRRTA
jgi:excisionase family DNA binding protein